MKKSITYKGLLISCLCSIFLMGCSSESSDMSRKFNNWKAETVVTQEEVTDYGIDNCFVSETINDFTFNRMYGKSFKEDCTISREDLRYLKVLHYNFNGSICLGEIVCSKEIDKKLLDIFRELYNNKYPIQRLRLIDDYNALDDPSMDDNNSSAFNFRSISGTTKLSNHSHGLAIDINPLYNPYVKVRDDGTLYVSPLSGKEYVNRDGDCPYMIHKDDICYKAFISRGFTWGGEWISLKDYQHFEFQLTD